MKHKIFFIGMIVSALVSLFYLLTFILPMDLFKVVPFLYEMSPIMKIVIIIVGFISFLFFTNVYQNYKEKEVFDEFGVRKKNAKRKMSSYRREMVEAQQLAEIERIVSKTELSKATKKGSKNPEEDLEKMIGMNAVKQKVMALKARMDFELDSDKFTADQETHHMIFYGPPGTGKTTVARIITGLYYDYGYIDENKIVEVDGNFLKGGNAAETEKKVRIILSKAKSGVLFVDEAYALTQSRDAAGKQAIATLIKAMEDERGSFIGIFAGYSKEMKEMLDANPGFRSRIKDYIEFPDYNDSDIREIAILMAGEKGFVINSDGMDNLMIRIGNERKSRAWGNARTVRNVIEESIDRHAYNYEINNLDKDKRYVLDENDILRVGEKHI